MAAAATRHTTAELNEVALQAQGGDPEAKERLVEMVRPYLFGYLQTLDQSRLSAEERRDLEQAGWLGVWTALATFDPTMGTKFSTWAHPHVRHEVTAWWRGRQTLSMTAYAFTTARALEQSWESLNGKRRGRSLADASGAELDSLTIERKRDGQVGRSRIDGAADIVRATAFPEALPDPDGFANGTLSAEEVYFTSEGERLEVAVFDLVDSLALLDADTWPEAVAGFCARYGLEVERVLQAVEDFHLAKPPSR